MNPTPHEVVKIKIESRGMNPQVPPSLGEHAGFRSGPCVKKRKDVLKNFIRKAVDHVGDVFIAARLLLLLPTTDALHDYDD